MTNPAVSGSTVSGKAAGKASGPRSIVTLLLIRGLIAIVFGIIALFAPSIAALLVVILVGAYLVIDGIVVGVRGLNNRRDGLPSTWLLIQGGVSLVAGIVAIVWPITSGLTAGVLLLWIIAGYAAVTGAVGLLSTREGGREPSEIVAPIVSLAFGLILGVVLFISPAATLLSLIWVVGVYALVFGALLTVIALRLNRKPSAPTE